MQIDTVDQEFQIKYDEGKRNNKNQIVYGRSKQVSKMEQIDYLKRVIQEKTLEIEGVDEYTLMEMQIDLFGGFSDFGGYLAMCVDKNTRDQFHEQ